MPATTFRILLLIFFTATWAATAEFSPSVYPFRNGVKYASAAEGAKALKKMGFDGIGSVHGNVLSQYLEAFDGEELKVFSIYVGGKVDATTYSFDPSVYGAIAQLKGRDALVELYIQGGKDASEKQAVAFVRKISALAEESGLKVVLYPHAGFHIDTVADALRVAEASGCMNVGVAFNLCHFLKVEPTSDLRATLTKAKKRLWSVSICGADTDGREWKTLIKPLNKGSFDQVMLLRTLREIGYKGDIGLQCYGINESPAKFLPDSLAAWRKILAAATQ